MNPPKRFSNGLGRGNESDAGSELKSWLSFLDPNIVLPSSLAEWSSLFWHIHTHPVTPSAYLILIWLAILHASREATWKMASLSLPGTLLHEIMHCGVGFLFGARPVSMDLIPRRINDRWVLGSVSFARITIFNAAPIAFAPLLMIPLAWWLFQHWMLPAFLVGHYGEWILAGYLLGCGVFSCLPSWIDIKLGATSALMWTGFGSGLWYAASLT